MTAETSAGPGRLSGARTDWLIAAGLFAATLLSRLPFRTTMFYAWDSVLYSRAIEHFDVRLQQPQPPGHIFYVGLVWLVNRLTGDANAAMVWISLLASALAVVATFWLGRHLFGRAAGIAAALLLATSLSFWLYGEVAYPYTLLAFLSTVCAGLIYYTWQGRHGWLVPAALALGLASGFRQDLLPFLMPLLLVGFYVNRSHYWKIAAATAVLAAAAASWYLPAALLSGGLAAYQAASSSQSDYLLRYSSVLGAGLPALRANFAAFTSFSGWALAGALPLVPALAGSFAARRSRRLLSGRQFWFLAVWAAPSILFYIFIHVGEYGYVFSFLPAALIAATGALSRIGEASMGILGRVRFDRKLPYKAAAPLVGANLVLFLILSPPMSANRLAARDDILESKIETIQSQFDAGSTFIIAVFDAQQALYYLPGYPQLSFDPSVDPVVSAPLGPAVRRVVIFEEYLHPADGTEAQSVDIACEQKLYYLDRQPGQDSVHIDWQSRSVSLAAA